MTKSIHGQLWGQLNISEKKHSKDKSLGDYDKTQTVNRREMHRIGCACKATTGKARSPTL